MKNNLTVVILTKNEENNIEKVVGNAQKVAEEILIIDSGSTDKTVELAQKAGARVAFRKWDNDFAAQRNFALDYVDTLWVLYLDADEILDDTLIKQIRQVIDGNTDHQYSMLRRIHAFGFEHKHGIFKPDEVTRLFKAKKVHWENKVHERPICSLPKKRLEGYIEHYTYSSWQDWWRKAGQYTSIWAEEAYRKNKKTTKAGAFYHAVYGLFRAYILELGFMDGWSGLYSSLQHFIYTLMKYLKLHELYIRNSKK